MNNRQYYYDLWIGNRDAESEKAFKYSILVNYHSEIIRRAYNEACSEFGIEFHSYGQLDENSTVYGQDTDGFIGSDAINKLNNLGVRTMHDIGYTGDMRTIIEVDESGDFSSWDAEKYIALLMTFIKLKLPDLSYTLVDDDMSLFDVTIGHGMIYT